MQDSCITKYSSPDILLKLVKTYTSAHHTKALHLGGKALISFRDQSPSSMHYLL